MSLPARPRVTVSVTSSHSSASSRVLWRQAPSVSGEKSSVQEPSGHPSEVTRAGCHSATPHQGHLSALPWADRRAPSPAVRGQAAASLDPLGLRRHHASTHDHTLSLLLASFKQVPVKNRLKLMARRTNGSFCAAGSVLVEDFRKTHL